MGLKDYRSCEGLWSSQSTGGLPANQLVQLRRVGEGPRVLPGVLGPRDWVVQLESWSLTSSSGLCRSSLSLRLSEALRHREWVQSVDYRVHPLGMCWSSLPVGGLLLVS